MNDFCTNYLSNVLAGLTLLIVGGSSYLVFKKSHKEIHQNAKGEGMNVSVGGDLHTYYLYDVKDARSSASTERIKPEKIEGDKFFREIIN